MSETSETRERTASCGCGGLTAVARGEPVDVYACSCVACQRRSGSAFSYAALFPETAVSIAGERKVWRHSGDFGRWIETSFCPGCGTTVYFHLEAWPGLVGVAAGCFANLDFPKPKTLYWASRRHRWLPLPDGTEIMDTQPEG